MPINSGEYTCVAANVAGNDTFTVNLIVNGKNILFKCMVYPCEHRIASPAAAWVYEQNIYNGHYLPARVHIRKYFNLWLPELIGSKNREAWGSVHPFPHL